MPAKMECPICGFVGNHGFDMVNGGMLFYHGGGCRFFHGDDNKIYKTELELFRAVTEPTARKSDPHHPGLESWIKARIADLSGHPRIAKRHYDAWKAANNNI